MPVGPGHIRGTDGVMPIQSHQSGTLEGPGSRTQRDERRMPYAEMDNNTLAILPSYLNGLKRKECYFDLGRDRASGMDGEITRRRPMSEFC
ncbi:MAG: hypothetical protein ACYSU5_25505 [Planctomycetota bacterium]|jgi:hypothetical protein